MTSTTFNSSNIKSPRIVFKNGHRKAVLCVAVLPMRGETFVCSGSEDKTVAVWSLRTGELCTILRGHAQRVSSVVTWSSAVENESLVISGSWDESIRIWPITKHLCDNSVYSEYNGNATELLEHTNRINALAIAQSDQDSRLVSGSADNTICVWSIKEKIFLYKLQDSYNVTWILCLATFVYPSQECIVLSGCKDRSVRIWSLSDSQNTSPRVITGHPSRIHGIAVVDVICGAESLNHNEEEMPKSSSNPLAVTVCRDYIIRVWSIESLQLLRSISGHTSNISSVAAHSLNNNRGGVIVTGSVKGNVRVWDITSGDLLRLYNGHSQACTAVQVFHPLKGSSDVVFVTGSKDMTVRTWMYLEDKSLLRRETRSRINAVAVHCAGPDATLLFVGSDDGSLQSDNIVACAPDTSFPNCWSADVAHSARVRGLAMYEPTPAGVAGKYNSKFWDLSKPLLVSSGRDMKIRVTDISTGEQVGKCLIGHTEVVTRLRVFPGSMFRAQGTERYPPFIVSGSEDCTVRVWSMLDGACMNTFYGHDLDVTDVDVLYMPMKVQQKMMSKSPSRNVSGMTTPVGLGMISVNSQVNDIGVGQMRSSNPVVVSVSMDGTLCVWSLLAVGSGVIEEDENESSSEEEEIETEPKEKAGSTTASSEYLVAKRNDAGVHLTCVRTTYSKGRALAIAGAGDAKIYVWSLFPVCELLTTLEGHSDEIQCLAVYKAEGLYPVLASGSWDMTVRVWNLEKMKHVRIIEGHRAEVTDVKIFTPFGDDPSIVSVSTDKTVQVLYDFLGDIPKKDFIEASFLLDLEASSKFMGGDGDDNRWPRTQALAAKSGVDLFFSNYSFLFRLALDRHRPDFLVEYLPLSRYGLLKTNIPYEYDEKAGQWGSLLMHALSLDDIVSVRVIVKCWSQLLSKPPLHQDDILYDRNARLKMDELLCLAKTYPKEFENLICAVQLMPVPQKHLPGSFPFMHETADHSIVLAFHNQEMQYTNAFKKIKLFPVADEVNATEARDANTFLFLPLPNMAHMEMMRAYSDTCEELNSVAIFDSDAGQLCLSYAWRAFGQRTHVRAMMIYFIYVAIAATSVYTFASLLDAGYWYVSLILIVMQLSMEIYFTYKEIFEFLVSPISYLSDIWNQLDGTVIVCGIIGNLARLIYWRETNFSRIFLSISSVCMWFNILFYLRAFESTGPLVSMILKICHDMQALIFVLLLVIMGFSQAFWLVSNVDDSGLPFASIDSSLLNSFSFMLGGYDPEGFNDLPLESFGLLLSCVYMLVVSILLLNLLIALMGDSYSEVREKGLAQWRLEQAQLIIEGAAAMSKEDQENKDIIYFRKKTDDVDTDIIRNQFNMETSITALNERVSRLQESYEEIVELLRENLKRKKSLSATNNV